MYFIFCICIPGNFVCHLILLLNRLNQNHFTNCEMFWCSHHLVARAYSCKGEFRQALNHEKETYKLYKAQLGDEHEKTKESGECLRHLTQQAVTLQKTVS